MALTSKVAALMLGAAAMLNVHATPVVATAQAASQDQQTMARAASAHMQAITRAAARIPMPSPVPEPTHYKLMLLGLALLLLFGRRTTGRHKPWTKH